MEIYKEEKLYNTVRGAILENGVHLMIFGSTALGSDGKTYYEITRVKAVYDELYDFEDEEYLSAGWSCDIDEPMIIRE